MLRNAKELRGYAIRATDGLIGRVDDIYFDDQSWVVRYLVVDTGDWLSRRQVLISPLALGSPDWMTQVLPVNLTKAQVEHSPHIDTQKPVSRQHETEFMAYYGYPAYWGGAGVWGMGAYAGSPTIQHRIEEDLKAHRTDSDQETGDSHLRSCNAVMGHRIEATDGGIGRVEDFLLDDDGWAIRYLIVGTSNWKVWAGHQVLVAPQWIDEVSWPEARVSVDLTRQALKKAPPYDPARQLDRQREQAMFEHYGREGYWAATTPPRPRNQDIPEPRAMERFVLREPQDHS